MTTKSKFSWSALTIDEQKLVLDIFANDGHTVYGQMFLQEQHCPESVIEEFAVVHQSNFDDPKETISVNGKPVVALNGVYGLTVLWSLARHYNITSSAMGRGFQAQELTVQLRTALTKPTH